MCDEADVFYTVTGLKERVGSQQSERKTYGFPSLQTKGKIHAI